jgi:hypothetical protein
MSQSLPSAASADHGETHMSNDSLAKVASGLAVGYGVTALFAPRALGRLYGLNSTSDTDALLRLYGSRTAGLGALALGTKEPAVRNRVIGVAAAISAGDTVSATASGVSGGVSARQAAMTAVTTAGVTALCVAAFRG